jgi:hypothetical protein
MNEKQIQEVMAMVDSLHYHAYSIGFECGKSGKSADSVIASNKAEAKRAAIESALREQVREVPEDPMDWPLPCDVKVGHGTIGKGCTLGTLVTRMKVLYEMATGNNADKVANRTEEERQALAEQFRAALAAPTQPAHQEQDLAYREAAQLATALFKKHYASKEEYASGQVVWGLCDSTAGIISQIDNMVSGLVMPQPAQVSQPKAATPWPISPDVAAELERSDWTPEEALRWYAAGRHYDTVPNGDGTSSARILDNGAVASNALKSMSVEYAMHKGDVALLEQPKAGWVLIATDAYEGGFGKGLQAAETGKEISNPWGDEPGREAWSLGYAMGKERYQPKAAQQEPMFWVRLRSDGLYEGPIHNAQIERVRKESGGWTPLYTAAPQREPMTDADSFQAGFRAGYERRDAEVKAALA